MGMMTWSVWVLCAAAPPVVEGPACQADGDCEISVFAGCCGSCCPVAPYAALSSEVQRQQHRCAAVDCAPPRCDGVKCLPVPAAQDVKAICQARRCVAVPHTPECRSNDDCVLVHDAAPVDAPCHQSPCGCCPGTTPRAVSAQSVLVPPSPPPPRASPSRPVTVPTPKPRHPEAPMPNCSPCPGPAPAHAACVQQRCVVAP